MHTEYIFDCRVFSLKSPFNYCIGAKSAETFLALCLVVAVGSAEITNRLGLSTSLGAFVAGALLAETNYRTQIEADLQSLRGLLLGLFFMTTGASVDPSLVLSEWPTTLALLAGLIGFKSFITSGKFKKKKTSGN